MSVTIQEVAAEAGVSPATVSRVLNSKDTVGEDLVARVNAAVERLDYRPNGPARSLRRQISDVWVVVVPDIENPFFTSVVRGLEDAAHEARKATVLCNSDGDLAKERSYIDWAIAERAAGVVIAAAEQRRSDVQPLREAGIPVVAVDRRLRDAAVDAVLVDNIAGARAATTHLMEAGAERIACITGPENATTAVERREGWAQALGDRAADDLVIHSDYRRTGGASAMRELLERDQIPDAVFVANNLMTVGALDAIAESSLRLRDDILLVAFDELPWSTYQTPTLSAVAQPAAEMGRAAGQLLRERSAAPDSAARTIILQPTLHVRQSSTRR